MRILIMTDSFFIPTGLAKVGREIALKLISEGHEVGYLGWYHRADAIGPIPQGLTYWFTNNNLYGSDVLDHIVSKFRPDVVLTVGDMWNVAYIADSNACRTRRLFQWCAYIAVDGEPLNGGLPPALVPVIEDVDIPIAYTNYAKRAVLKSCMDAETRMRIRTIYHGVDTEIFRPLPWEERQALRTQYGLDGKFMVLTVARNQSRKCIPESLNAWKTFSEMPENKGQVVFWPHMHFEDPMGWRIDGLFDILGLRNRSVMYYNEVAHGPSEMHLLPEKELAKLYQVADAFMLLSGEGFGLPTLEAMATGLPCILLDHSASAEIGGEGRAELVPVHGWWTGMHLTQRPIPGIDSIINALTRIRHNPQHRQSIAKRGYDFAVQNTWQNVGHEWAAVFNQLEVPFIRPLALEAVS